MSQQRWDEIGGQWQERGQSHWFPQEAVVAPLNGFIDKVSESDLKTR